MVDGMVGVLQIIHVKADFGCEELRIENRRLLTRGTVHPAHITHIGPWGLEIDLRGRYQQGKKTSS